MRALSPFRFLRTLVTSNLYRQLYVEQLGPTRPAGDRKLLAEDEARILLYASRIAQGIPSLEGFHINERGLGDRNMAFKGYVETQSSGGFTVETWEKM